MVLGFIPRAHQLGKHRRAGGHDDHGIRRPQRGQRHPLGVAVVIAHATIDRQDQRELGITRAALRVEIEVAQLDDVIAPELEAHRLGHAERVDVDDAAAHGELRHVFHHLHALEADGFEVRRKIFQPTHVAFAQFEPRTGEGARQGGLFEDSTGRGQQQAHAAAPELLERLHAFAGHFGMRFDFAEAFSWRVQGDGDVVDQ